MVATVLGVFEVDIIEPVLDSFELAINDSVLDNFEVSTALLDGLDDDPTLTVVVVVKFENVGIDPVLPPNTTLKAEVTEVNLKLEEDDELERLGEELDMTLEEANEEVGLDMNDEMTDLDVAVGDEGALVCEEIESLVDDASVVVLPNEETGTLLIDDARLDEELKLDGDELEVDGRETELNDRELENEDRAEGLALERLKNEELDLEDERLGLEYVVLEVVFNVVGVGYIGDEYAEDNNEDDGFTVVLEAELEVVELGEIEVEEVKLLLIDDNEAAELENIEDEEVETLFINDSVVAELESIEDKRVPEALEE
ncbi:hypothetical protein KCU81_g4946, partial [Aureobasidium melanogenum]